MTDAKQTDKPSFVYVTYIATTPEKAWEALTSPRFTEQYFFGRRVESDWRKGSRARYLMPDGSVDIDGEVLASDPPRLLSFTFTSPNVEESRDHPSRVTFEIKPMGSSVKLTLRHEDLSPDALEADPDVWRGVNNGWPAIISCLKSVLETGRPCLDFSTLPQPGDRQEAHAR